MPKLVSVARLIMAISLVIGMAWIGMFHGQLGLDRVILRTNDAGFAGALIFVILFASATVLLLPGLFLTLAGGALFGPIWGTLLNLVGATLGAAFSFLVARYLAVDWLETHSRGRLQRLIRGVEREGWVFVAFVRLVPILPFIFMNYALGLTRINFFSYVATTFLSLLPSVAAITYLGHVGRAALTDDQALVHKAIISVALVAILIFLPYFLKRYAHKAYQEGLPTDEGQDRTPTECNENPRRD